MHTALNQVDLGFVVDTTGSMGSFIDAARTQMIAVINSLRDDMATPINLHVGVVEYRDHPPQEKSFVFRVHALIQASKKIQGVLNNLKPNGGGDAPEAVLDGLNAASEQLAWREHSHRIAILVGDAPPHGHFEYGKRGDNFPDGCPKGHTFDSITAQLEEKNIVLYSLGLTTAVNNSFTRLAHFTGGEYFPVKHGNDAISAIKGVLENEFKHLHFDQQVLATCKTIGEWNIDTLCDTLQCPRGRVSASVNRLGKRHLL